MTALFIVVGVFAVAIVAATGGYACGRVDEGRENKTAYETLLTERDQQAKKINVLSDALDAAGHGEETAIRELGALKAAMMDVITASERPAVELDEAEII